VDDLHGERGGNGDSALSLSVPASETRAININKQQTNMETIIADVTASSALLHMLYVQVLVLVLVPTHGGTCTQQVPRIQPTSPNSSTTKKTPNILFISPVIQITKINK
jgi:hypothetical protein